jgi:hypothetical protein
MALGAVQALTAVQVCFRCAPEAPPGMPAGKAALQPLYLHGIVLWDEHRMKVRLERGIEVSDRFIAVLDTIITARGCVVPGEFLRAGRRAVCAGGKGMLKHTFRKRNEIATQEAWQKHGLKRRVCPACGCWPFSEPCLQQIFLATEKP